ncbi:hypothetical protein BJX63DRAFT_413368 [Aspergillus granulosus]|uniref:Uncharacterized protein n=1 Tax=Aspergillus granulosus TaxID=176169 RepID=A0ABR4GWR1_9EURO
MQRKSSNKRPKGERPQLALPTKTRSTQFIGLVALYMARGNIELRRAYSAKRTKAKHKHWDLTPRVPKIRNHGRTMLKEWPTSNAECFLQPQRGSLRDLGYVS